jgi:TolB-like protein/DNA-binding winged helix-turn-helix (wHTH) protein/Tfp pilus assembly protein PilF
MTVTARQVVCFGPFELDLHSGELFKHGSRIKLQGQPIQILRILLEQPGKLVTREEISQKLWPSDTFVDFEHSLNTAVKKLRTALGDEAETPRYIETLPRRGYRFVGEIKESIPVEPEPALPASVPPSTAPVKVSLPRWNRLAVLLGSIAVVAMATAATLLVLHYRTSNRIESIAVLPLANLSGDQEQEYFADGMTEELITDLAQIKALRVISRTSVMRYKGSKKSLPEIGRELDVDAVLEGSVQRSGDRVRISAQLIQTSSDHHLWAQSYERDLKDVLGLRDELARAIASEIRIELTPKEQVRLTRAPRVVPDAYEAYLKGRRFADKSTPEGLTKAIEYFEHAIARDPKYALAWASLGHAYFLRSFISESPIDERCIPAMKKAMELDENLAEAHVDFADLIFHRDWMWREGEDEFRRAVELDPGSVDAQQHYALALWQLGRFEEAIREMQRTRDLDPLSVGINMSFASLLRDAKRFDEAEKQFLKTIELEPTYVDAYIALGSLYEDSGRNELAVAMYRKATNLESIPARRDSVLVEIDKRGTQGYWNKLLEFAVEESKRRHVAPITLAALYAHSGNKERAIQFLQLSYEQRSPRLTWINAQSTWDSLRSDPKFQEIIRKMQFPKPQATKPLN